MTTSKVGLSHCPTLLGAGTMGQGQPGLAETRGTDPPLGQDLMSGSLPSGVRGLELTPCERRFAQAIRAITRGADVLYHGTRYAEQIYRSGLLRCPEHGTTGVSFSRVPEVAVFCALLPRPDADGEPAVMIFDRLALRRRYRVEPHHDGWEGHGGCERDEAEEIIWGQDVGDLPLHLVGTFWASMVERRPVC